jgi:predicted nucleic acid-binding protein
VIVDSSVWINYLAKKSIWQAKRLDRELDQERLVGLTDVIYTEVLQGIKHDHELLIVERHLLDFPILRLEGLDDFRKAAQLYRTARRKGHTIRNLADCFIAAVCIREKRPLLHNDVDFDRLAQCSDLQVVSPD